MEDIMIFKLNNGETLISKVYAENDTQYYLEKPMIITTYVTNMGQYYDFLPWAPGSTDEAITIDKTTVFTKTSPNEEYVELYNKKALKVISPGFKEFRNYVEGNTTLH